MANAPKPTTVKKESSSSASNLFATLVIPICIAIGVCIFIFLLGDANNFIDNNKENLPKQGNYAGMAYKGGPIVAILIGLLLMVIVFSVERLIVIGKATGKMAGHTPACKLRYQRRVY